jgi:hypothetical protein
MKLAIMQPYLFPYIGYFQLINAVDRFVLYDDVNYINKGWINRNQILVNDQAHMFTIPLREASQNKKINEIEVSNEKVWREKLLKTVAMTYKKAPLYRDVFPLIESILSFEKSNLSEFIHNSIIQLCKYLGIATTIIPTSSIYANQGLKGQSRIIDICDLEKANIYINPTNGRSLYQQPEFLLKGIDLKFIRTRNIAYRQYSDIAFVPYLSIIDVLMFNHNENLKKILTEYDLD